MHSLSVHCILQITPSEISTVRLVCFLQSQKLMVLFMRNCHAITHRLQFQLACEWPCSWGSVLLQLTRHSFARRSSVEGICFLLLRARLSAEASFCNKVRRLNEYYKKCWVTSQIRRSMMLRFVFFLPKNSSETKRNISVTDAAYLLLLWLFILVMEHKLNFTYALKNWIKYYIWDCVFNQVRSSQEYSFLCVI